MPSFASRRHQSLVEQLVLLRHQLVGLARYLAEHHGGRHAIGAGRVAALVDLRLQAGDPDLEEFVQVAADDAQKAQALEQRHVRIGRLRQHPAIELELSELAVEQRGRSWRPGWKFGFTGLLEVCWRMGGLKATDASVSTSRGIEHSECYVFGGGT